MSKNLVFMQKSVVVNSLLVIFCMLTLIVPIVVIFSSATSFQVCQSLRHLSAIVCFINLSETMSCTTGVFPLNVFERSLISRVIHIIRSICYYVLL